jgi:hypothetical protein
MLWTRNPQKVEYAGTKMERASEDTRCNGDGADMGGRGRAGVCERGNNLAIC